ncbi:MAG: uridine diphosphate-N-acetylglucosamine-binding protein YvcK [Corynebacterium sp.]|nr:uridine diphosphate-N-acetylglucosamine-binding protein YvcK [Corynebacterium sp.]
MQSKIVSLGGGHGLFQTLRAVRELPAAITAIVTVADDGGSSGRIRRELGLIPPGDLRMALAALSSEPFWEEVLQHRFGGHGALNGHAVGNLLLSGLEDVLGDEVKALDTLAELTQSRGRVLPMCSMPLDIEADVSGLDTKDPRVMHLIRGQVAVATTPGHVRRVRLIPENPPACPQAIEAIHNADLVTLGPGSWFSSVIPHVLVPDIVKALKETKAHKVVVLNLTSEPGETTGFSLERHIHMLASHAVDLKVDTVLIDSGSIGVESSEAGSHALEYVSRAAERIGAQIVVADVSSDNGKPIHDPHKLGQALGALIGI